MRTIVCWAAVAVLFFAGRNACALGPHECIILVNRKSQESMELANFYADLRQIPPVNIIHLDLPDKARDAGVAFTVEEFREHILEPTRRVLRERAIAGHILVWLYSLDFPAVIANDPPLSLTGLTFTRGEVPDRAEIASGNWLSPLFAGPDRPDGPASPPATLETFTLALTNRMPVPAMMLGWSGPRGMTVAAIRDQLRAAAAGDGAQPSASVFFETGEDVRAQTRAWQFAPAERELAALNIAAIVASNAPAARTDLMGVLAGRAVVEHIDYGALRPGAYADHLTSFAALFHDPFQSKLTAWLRRGAAASSGTVTEPGSLEIAVRLWAKFPAARLFTHYAAGCTMVESLYLATRMPLQTLFVGDALCAPWAKPPGITLINMADDEDAPVKGRAELLASSWGGFGQAPPTTIFFLDGRPVNQSGSQPSLQFDTTQLHDGYHEVRVVGYAQERVRHQGSDLLALTTRNRNRWSEIGGYTPRQKVDLYHPLTFTINAAGAPVEAAIIAQERILARAPYRTNMTLQVHPLAVGAGPVSFQAVVVYDAKEPVRSAPLPLEIAPLNQAPSITGITITTNETGERSIAFAATDAESDPLNPVWFYDFVRDAAMPAASPADGLARLDKAGGVLAASSATNTPAFALFEPDTPSRIKELLATVRTADDGAIDGRDLAGIVFNHLDDRNHMFWGLDGTLGAWVLLRVRDGVEERIFSRGAPIEPGASHQLMALAIGTTQIAFFVDDNLQGVADVTFAAGRVGLRTGLAGTESAQFLVAPASAARAMFREAGATAVVSTEGGEAALAALAAAVRDVQRTTVRPVAAP